MGNHVVAGDKILIQNCLLRKGSDREIYLLVTLGSPRMSQAPSMTRSRVVIRTHSISQICCPLAKDLLSSLP